MDRTTLRVVLGCLLVGLFSEHCQALDSNTEHAVREATFEFLAPGKDAGSKGLVGTAFAIGPNEFITTAHLVDSTIGSRFATPVLVDAQQVEHGIADILQFSEKRDYVVFSLKRPLRIKPLPIQPSGSMPAELYFAGWNPSGRILIERSSPSGLTPDAETQEFDWLRFSGQLWGAASGGPVLNQQGRVIAIVQGVARDGGANYAGQIGPLSNEPPISAQLHGMEMLRALMPAVSSIQPLNAQIPLPMSLDNFSLKVQQLRRAYFDQMVGPLLEATRTNFVVSGEGAADTCALLNGSNCQCRPREGSSGVLVVNDLPTNKPIQLADDIRTVARTVVVRMRSRENNTQRDPDPLNNASVHLDLALRDPTPPDHHQQVASTTRSWAAKGEDTAYADFHNRPWRMRTWPVLDRDSTVVSMVRELPDGYVVLTRSVPTALEYAAALQLKFLANLIYYECEDLSGEGVAQVASLID